MQLSKAELNRIYFALDAEKQRTVRLVYSWSGRTLNNKEYADKNWREVKALDRLIAKINKGR